LFYVAFFQQFDPVEQLRCSYNNYDDYKKDCLYNLQVQLLVVFGSLILINNALELILPFLSNLFNQKKDKMYREEENHLFDNHNHDEKDFVVTDAEKELELSTYENTMADFEELGKISF
jgi:hypothetical protein